jgi:hypothetical protein
VQRPHDPEGDQDVPDAEDVAERPGGREAEDVAQERQPRSGQGGRVWNPGSSTPRPAPARADGEAGMTPPLTLRANRFNAAPRVTSGIPGRCQLAARNTHDLRAGTTGQD